MEVKVITLSEISKDNPALCLSPLRVFNDECHKCDAFKTRFQYLKRKYPDEPVDVIVEKAIEEMECKPRIKKEYIELLKRKEKLLKELAEIRKMEENL